MISRASHTITLAEPLPSTISPDSVIALLRDHFTIMKLQPLVASVELGKSEPAGDFSSHFSTLYASNLGRTDNDIQVYTVHENVVIVPGIGTLGKKHISFRARFQDFEDGVRSEANAPGDVVLYAVWCLERQDGGNGQCMLREDVRVKCPSLLITFVRWTMERAHRELFQRLMDKLRHSGDKSSAEACGKHS